jgi:hypothetical protein
LTAIRMIFNRTESQDGVPEDSPEDPLHRFRNWRGFLAAAIAVNLLFAYGMWNNTADPSVAIWFKVLVWLPFNAIATALYIVFMLKLGKACDANNQTGGVFYSLLSGFMIVANWILLFAA